ncbi:helix-turn-helix domain-containing protein [Amycolatopsis suaedae]|uniref:PucR family transcriptional regulator n=1 Tax=Amycolatopsis suaedae TaxID=2510978 RepID=A0A4Q7JCE8_9PSEU|nr:helix-turn-helix domain-containing protein [Amycolatopsis suaedae]RZQ64726.1 PucR family transcriptional regulator [Amycolatopsis suaedae]
MTVERAEVSLPPRLADIFRPELPSLAEDIVGEVRSQIPEYARPLDGPYGRSIRAGVEHAITMFVEQIADPGAPKQNSLEVHRKLGQNEMREGRSLDTLQAAYRVGARVAWRRIMRIGRRSGLSSAVMSQLADAMFAFIDELASIALDGYLEAKASSAGALETWRRRLLQLLLERPLVPREAIAELAQLTGWAVPEEATPIALRPTPVSGHVRRHPSLDADILAELDTHEPVLLVPGELTEERLANVQRALPGCRMSVGPTVRLEFVADSLRWARRALALVDDGVLPPGRTTFSSEHLATLLLHSDEQLVTHLRRTVLAPLEGMTDKQKERLTETLRAWLDTQGSVLGIAERLNVHPQTVRYRMRQLHATFGEQLADPATRFAMELVLRADRTAARPATAVPWPAYRLPDLPGPRLSARA